MAEPGTGTGIGRAGGDAAPPPPPETVTAGPGPAATPQPHQPPPQAEASGAAGQTPRQIGMDDAAGKSQPPRAPSQERAAAAADAENQLPAPLPSLQEQQQGDTAKDDKGAAMAKPRRAKKKPSTSRWARVRSPVLWLLSLFRLRRQHPPIEQSKGTYPRPPEDGAGDDPAKPAAKQKDKAEGGERRRDEAEASTASARKEMPAKKPAHQSKRRKNPQRTETVLPTEGGVAGVSVDKPRPEVPPAPIDGAPGSSGARLKKFQKAGRFVKCAMAWYHGHRSPEKEKPLDEQPSPNPAQGDKPPEKKPQNPLWPREEARLEEILEKACARMVKAEYTNLGDEKMQRCLLTFSVFALGSEVKKQAVTYWWFAQFYLPKVSCAEDIFSKLAAAGFLEPIKNRCSRVIHGCWVNPLVHWMVKRQARDKFALDDRGNPADEQPKSDVFCLTASNRVRLQNRRRDDDSQDPPKIGAASQSPQNVQTSVPSALADLKRKQVILNISAHVYRLPDADLLLSHLADSLVVLQLGRWTNSDDKTYMEVEALQSLGAIGSLKKLRYLGLRGLSRLTELPGELQRLQRLTVLDVRGCQNLVEVASQAVKTLKGLTHLDLTECYMLEYIGRGVADLSELQVFKGFVFGTGAARRSGKACRTRRACRIADLKKLKKLRKLSVNVATDANVGRGDMAHLEELDALRSLTVTWGELPSILSDSKKEKERKQLLDSWTGLVLPSGLEKLDLRCYPEKKKLPPEWFKVKDRMKLQNLQKLYVRGGDVVDLEIPDDNKIKTLRLRYLNKFSMQWDKLFSMFKKIQSVELVDKDPKVMKNEAKGEKGKEDQEKEEEAKGEKGKEDQEKEEEAKEEEERDTIKKRMGVPEATLDQHGVWVRDEKELKQQEESKSGSSAAAAEHPAAQASGGEVAKKGVVGTDEGDTDKSSVPETSEGAQATGKEPKEDAPKTEAATGAADVVSKVVSKVSGDAGNGGEDGGDAGKAQTEGKEEQGGAEAAEVSGEVKKLVGGDTDGEDEGQGGGSGRRVSEAVDEQPTGEDDDTCTADATTSPAVAQPPELPQRPHLHSGLSDIKEEDSDKVPAAGTTPTPPLRAATTSSLAPAAAGEAAAKPKETAKADDDDGSTGAGTENRSSSTTP